MKIVQKVMFLFKLPNEICRVSRSIHKISIPDAGDIDIFKNSIEDLKAIDSEFIEGKKYILFKNLGICIGGMTGKKIPEGKLLIAFDKNHFDFFECFIEV